MELLAHPPIKDEGPSLVVHETARDPLDPRYYQIAILTSLLGFSWFALDFTLPAPETAAVLVGVLGAQWGFSRMVGRRGFEPKSALISGLSLCLLLRTHSVTLAALAGILAVGSKFLLRWKKKHVFNPTNFSLVVLILSGGFLADLGIAQPGVWISPGQWGRAVVFAAALACLGLVVVMRSRRSDVTWAFVLAYGAWVFGRALWLGDPLAIPAQQMAHGGLVLFAFFMISDPRSIPDHRLGRIVFACAVATGAAYLQFEMHQPNGLFYALFFGAFLTPGLDFIFPQDRYRWEGRRLLALKGAWLWPLQRQREFAVEKERA